MFKRLIIVGAVSMSLLAWFNTEVKAYTYKGYGGCYGCGSYKGQWTVAGGQQPGSIAILVGLFTLQKGALVCTNPRQGIEGSKDVRVGVGGIEPIEAVSSESDLVFDSRGRFTLNQVIPTSVKEFEDFCSAFPDQCTGTTGRELFNATYDVSNENCKPNWITFEYLWGDHLAEGTVHRDCTDPDDLNTCAKQDDNVIYSCTTNVNFKNYHKVGSVLFNCVCIAGKDGTVDSCPTD